MADMRAETIAAWAAMDERSKGHRRRHGRNANGAGRVVSAIAATGLALYGLKRAGPIGLATGAAGGLLLYRAITGSWWTSGSPGKNGAHRAGPTRAWHQPRGVPVDQSINIGRPAHEIYRFWKDPQNLPRFMEHLRSVVALDDRRSRWEANGPAGAAVQWMTEVVNDQENRVIAWRSLPGSDVASTGSVWFRPDPKGRGTDVHVRLQYAPPPGKPPGVVVARWLGQQPHLQIWEDLRRLKQLLESGETAGTNVGEETSFARLRSRFVPPGDLNGEW